MLLGELFEKKQDFLMKQKEWTLRVFYYDITEEYALAQCDNKCSIDELIQILRKHILKNIQSGIYGIRK